MFCFEEKTNVYIAENVSAIFLCPDFTPEAAPVEEQTPDFLSVCMLLSGDTPADVLSDAAETEYQIIPDSCEKTCCTVQLPLSADDLIACETGVCSSADVISVSDTLAEEKCPMFLFRKHIPSNFYITVCNGDFYECPMSSADSRDEAYCSSVRGFVPCGMELKIRVQSFKL